MFVTFERKNEIRRHVEQILASVQGNSKFLPSLDPRSTVCA
jgi:hypothetical protein